MACKILHADLAQLGFDLFLADAESLGNAAAFEMPMVIFPPCLARDFDAAGFARGDL